MYNLRCSQYVDHGEGAAAREVGGAGLAQPLLTIPVVRRFITHERAELEGKKTWGEYVVFE